jgi:hypothetical protein
MQVCAISGECVLFSGADWPCSEIKPFSTDIGVDDKDNGRRGATGFGED